MNTLPSGEPANAAWWGGKIRYWTQALQDGLRLIPAALYWNARKSHYVATGRRGPCPCHAPSDSGLPGVTACEAVIGWHSPTRFRAICPKLTHFPHRGWRCSASRIEVRPAWGRLALITIGSSALIYLALALLALAGLRMAGLPLGATDVLWPTRWSRVTEIRAEQFFQRAQSSLRRREIRPAILNLQVAVKLAPSCPAYTELLAKLLEGADWTRAEALRRQLLSHRPEQAEAVAQARLPGLVARGLFHEVQELAMERLIASPPEASGAWLYAFQFATRQTRDRTAKHRLLDSPHLPNSARAVLGLQAQLEFVTRNEAVNLLRLEANSCGRDAVRLHFVLSGLIERDESRSVLKILAARRNDLRDRDYIELRLQALQRSGERSLLEREFELLAYQPIESGLIDLLCAHLLRCPDNALADSLARACLRSSRKFGPETCASLSAIYLVSAARGHEQLRNWALAALAEAAQVPFSASALVLRGMANPKEATGAWLHVVRPIDLPMLYAVHERLVIAAT